jgi:purine-nucleoside phosphorylase
MVALPVRLFAALGITRLFVTNAAGGIDARLTPGSLMLIADQVNLTFANPLHGPLRTGEDRFPDMSSPYDPAWSGAARLAALELGIPLQEGTYAGLSGPSYETPAEVRMLRTMGADAVGMSTVLEVVAARALGMRCLGFSIIANRAAGLSPDRLSHDDVLAAATRAGISLGAVIERLLTIAD